jgi:hypothetical protein
MRYRRGSAEREDDESCGLIYEHGGGGRGPRFSCHIAGSWLENSTISSQLDSRPNVPKVV